MTNFPVVATGPGVSRHVLADSPALMVVAFRFAAGATGAIHHHPHVQATHVAAGRFRFSLGEAMREVGPNDTFIIPSGMAHGCLCLEDGLLIDTFTPRRDDFL